MSNTRYSKIHSMRIENFMAIKDSTLVFTDDFINLKGMNSRGKSATQKAFRVLMTQYKANKQRKWIRWGQDFFRLTMEFQDGIKIVYTKMKNGKSRYDILDIDSKTLFSTYQDGVYAPIVEVPEPVERLLGMVKHESMSPNFMKSREKLFLVDTTGKTNYEFLNGVLEPEDVHIAQDKIKEDIKEKRASNNEILHTISAYREIVNKDSVVSEEVVDVLLEKDKKLDSTSVAFDTLKRVVDDYNSYNSISVIPEYDTVSAKQLKLLDNLASMVDISNKLNSIVDMPEVKPVSQADLDVFKQLRGLSKLVQDYNGVTILPNIEDTTVKDRAVLKQLLSITELNHKYITTESLPEIEIPKELLVSKDLLLKGLRVLELLQSYNSVEVLPSVESLDTTPLIKIGELIQVYSKYQAQLKEINTLEEETKVLDAQLKELESQLDNTKVTTFRCPDCNHMNVVDLETGKLITEHVHEGVLK